MTAEEKRERQAHDAEVKRIGCRDWRIYHGWDVPVEERDGFVLVRVVRGVDAGRYILWGDNHKAAIRIGSMDWARAGWPNASPAVHSDVQQHQRNTPPRRAIRFDAESV